MTFDLNVFYGSSLTIAFTEGNLKMAYSTKTKLDQFWCSENSDHGFTEHLQNNPIKTDYFCIEIIRDIYLKEKDSKFPPLMESKDYTRRRYSLPESSQECDLDEKTILEPDHFIDGRVPPDKNHNMLSSKLKYSERHSPFSSNVFHKWKNDGSDDAMNNSKISQNSNCKGEEAQRQTCCCICTNDDLGRQQILSKTQENFIQKLICVSHENLYASAFKAQPPPFTTYGNKFATLSHFWRKRRRLLLEHSMALHINKQSHKVYGGSRSKSCERHKNRCEACGRHLYLPDDSNSQPYFESPHRRRENSFKSSARIIEKKDLSHDDRDIKVEDRIKKLNYTPDAKIRRCRGRQVQRHLNNCYINHDTLDSRLEVPKLPDFMSMHQKLEKDLNECKLRNSKVTVIEPFNLSSNIEKQKKIDHHAHRINLQSRPNMKRHHSWAGTQNESTTQNFRRNLAFRLRLESNKRRALSLIKRQSSSTKARKEELKKRLNEHMNESDLMRQDRLKKTREGTNLSSKTTATNYDAKMVELESKIIQTPTLIERQTILAAKHSAEKRYKDAIKAAGLSEEELRLNLGEAQLAELNFDSIEDQSEYGNEEGRSDSQKSVKRPELHLNEMASNDQRESEEQDDVNSVTYSKSSKSTASSKSNSIDTVQQTSVDKEKLEDVDQKTPKIISNESSSQPNDLSPASLVSDYDKKVAEKGAFQSPLSSARTRLTDGSDNEEITNLNSMQSMEQSKHEKDNLVTKNNKQMPEVAGKSSENHSVSPPVEDIFND